MTHTTEQERARFEAEYAEKLKQVLPAEKADRMIEWRLSRKGDGYEDREVDEAWWGWKTARRAPSAPVQQGWKLVPVEPTSEMCFKGAVQIRWSAIEQLAAKCYNAMLAAAPQPPEAAQLDDTNVADMAQAVDSKEAAPVQLPGPVAFALEWTFDGEERGIRLYDDERHCRFDAESDGGVCSPLYTEQQVRELLAQQARND